MKERREVGWGGGTRAQRKAVVKQSAEPHGEAVLDTRTRTFPLETAPGKPLFCGRAGIPEVQ